MNDAVIGPMSESTQKWNDTIWERALHGKTAVLLGASLPVAPQLAHRLLRVDCASWDRPLGPMLELREQLHQLIMETSAPIIMTSPTTDAPRLDITQAINRLQRQLDCPLVILLESIHRADEATVQLLERVLASPTHLLASVILQSSVQALDGPVGTLVEHVLDAHGPAALVRGGEVEEPPARGEEPDPHDLSVEILRVLRAAAVVGDTFEADLVAGMLGLDVVTVLELLQMAIDQRVALVDQGKGIFRLPPKMGDRLRATTTRSLAEAWHADLASMMSLARPPEPEASHDEAPTTPKAEPRTPETDAMHELARKWRGRDLTSRGAEHAEAAGDRDAAAFRYINAAEEASSMGGHERAIELVRRALQILPVAPATDAERLLRVRCLLTQGRVVWRAAGILAGIQLTDALTPLQQARELLVSRDGADIHAEIGLQIARVAYDIGDVEHFRVALVVLGQAEEALLATGDQLGAARLLNEEAAVLVRIGELAKAAELLARSRDVFMRHADHNPDARRELAQTEHLVARLPLHGPAGSNDASTISFATECARRAEQAYAELKDAREHARVQETMGRLSLLAGRPEEARRSLELALRRQEQLGDAIGLARTTAALAELLADIGAPDDALKVLGDSVALNLQLGSRQGVVYNLRGLEELERALRDPAPDILGAIGEMRTLLEASARGAQPAATRSAHQKA